MDFSALIQDLEPHPETAWVVTLEGQGIPSELSSLEYLYFESLVYFGEPEIKDESWSPWRQGDDLIVVFRGKKYEVSAGKLRTYLAPSFSKLMSAVEAQQAGLFEDLVAQGKKKFLIEEYGLQTRRTYYLRIAQETYHLPPPGPGKPPQTRTNSVLWISDKPYIQGKPQSPLTPAYERWTY